jgi:hypothetical protein
VNKKCTVEAIACARRCRSSRLTGWWTRKEQSEKWRAEEEEKHEGSLTPKNVQFAGCFPDNSGVRSKWKAVLSVDDFLAPRLIDEGIGSKGSRRQGFSRQRMRTLFEPMQLKMG